MHGRPEGLGGIVEVLRRTPTSFVALEVRWVLYDRVGPDALTQVVYQRGPDSAPSSTTLAAVHHSGLELPSPATYERVRREVPFLSPQEVGSDLGRYRGLRWLPRGDPAGRSWQVGSRLVRLVDGEAAARALAAHFRIPFVVDGAFPSP